MGRLDFHFEFYSEVENIPEELKTEAGQRLSAMSEERNDLVGASVAIEDIAGDVDSYLYQARIVAYIKPENITVVEKADSPEAALKEALATIEKRVRKEREKLSQHWQQPDEATRSPVYELTPKEMYASYAEGADPQELIDQGQAKIAARLITEEQMGKEAAYYAAEVILERAQTLLSGQPT
jgi:ribosome-associated translation inhibitor RaiA